MADELLSRTAVVSYNEAAIARLTGWTLEVNQESVDVTGLSDDGWRILLVDLKEWSLTFEGIVTKAGYEVLRNKLVNSDTTGTVSIVDSAASTTIIGAGFINSNPLQGSVEEKATFSGTIQGTGVLTIA